MINVSIPDIVSPSFYSLWLAPQSHIVAKGGRSSTKSSVISLKLVVDFLKDDNGNVVCLRKIGQYLRTSVYEQIKWAIYMLHVQHLFEFRKSPLAIIHKRTGTAFYFYGVDDPMKLKSMTIANGYVMALWFEELAEFSGVEDIDVVEDTFIRRILPSGKRVKVYFSYNPPKNPYEWVNEWVEDKQSDPEYFIHSSTYLDVNKKFLSPSFFSKIKRYKENDPDYYRWMYLGDVIGLGNLVYNIKLFHWIESIPDNDDIIVISTSTDVGHEVSATTFSAYGYTKRRNVILLDTYYYSPMNKSIKKAPSELSRDFKSWRDGIAKKYKRPIDLDTVDSADGALRNQIFRDYGIRMHPVNKLKNVDMVDFVQNLLAQGRFFMLHTSNNQIFYEEHKKYQWDQNTLQSDDPKVIKEDDHTVDNFKYYVLDNRRKLGLTR